MPRWAEILLATTGMILVLPMLLVIAVAVKFTSRGPVLFRQERVGRGGRLFKILKFRTMVTEASELGGKLTVGSRDPRVTAVGYWLRRFKLDELPQLWNVLVGDMKFVGPRPEVPEYVMLWNEVQRAALLAVPPGITDPAAIFFRDEEEMLGGYGDPERAYVEELMPRKLEMNVEYLKIRNARSDVGLIASTVRRAMLRV